MGNKYSHLRDDAEPAKGGPEVVGFLIRAPVDEVYGRGPDGLRFHPLEQHNIDDGYQQTPLVRLSDYEALRTENERLRKHLDERLIVERALRRRAENAEARNAELVKALDQLLDDMGENGLCVCQAAKDQAIAALGGQSNG